MGPVVQLRRLIEAALRARGLEPVRMVVCPGDTPDGPHEIQIVAALPDGWERTETDEAFDEVIAGARQADLDQKFKKAQQELEANLRRRLQDGDGIL